MRFEYYMEYIQELMHVVQELENLCVQMSQMTDIEKLNSMFNYDCDSLCRDAKYYIKQIKNNDYTTVRANDKTTVEYQKRCEILNKEVAKLTARYEEYEVLCVKTHADTLQRLIFGPQFAYITSDNERLKLVVEKLQAEAKIKESEIKKNEATIATENAKKAEANLAIEEHKTEQLRLQAEERKAREEEAILSVEERCKIMYNEFLNTLQGGIVNPDKTK